MSPLPQPAAGLGRLLQGRWAPLTAFLAGGLAVLGFAPFAQFWLLPFLLALLFQLWRRADGWRQAAWRGGAFGLGLFLGGVSWVYVSLSAFGGMPMPLAALATLLFCAYLALFPALAGGLFRRFLPAGLGRQALLFAGLWALADLLRGWLFTGFPWLALGYAQAPPSPLAGYGPLFGVYGLTLLTALAGACLLGGLRGWAGLCLLLAGGWGLQQMSWTEARGEVVSVALVQGNIAQDLKWQPERFQATLLLYRDLVAAHPARLTVLPETALPAFLDYVPQDYLAELKALARRQEGDLLLGVPTGAGASYWNSAVSFGAAPTQQYSKSHLVPFGEFIPPGFAWFLQLARIPMSSFSAGPVPQLPLALAGQQVAVNICYEDLFGRELLPAVPQATLLVNMSNTAWFGRSLAQAQHLQIAQLRALETGRPMLRATNTGMTAVVGPDGRVLAVLEPFTTAVLEASVQGYGGLTPYARLGDLGALLLALGCLGAAWVGRRKD